MNERIEALAREKAHSVRKPNNRVDLASPLGIKIIAAAIEEAEGRGYRRGVEEARSVCFHEDTLCAAPIHCGCREKIAQVMLGLMEVSEPSTHQRNVSK
jgi:hypothetical protein